jgi:hypothetical protein
MDRGSYDPEGIKKNPDALIDELKGFYSSVERFGKQLNDPNNIMGDVLNELKKFNGAFAPATNWSDPNDQGTSRSNCHPSLPLRRKTETS